MKGHRKKPLKFYVERIRGEAQRVGQNMICIFRTTISGDEPHKVFDKIHARELSDGDVRGHLSGDRVKNMFLGHALIHHRETVIVRTSPSIVDWSRLIRTLDESTGLLIS